MFRNQSFSPDSSQAHSHSRHQGQQQQQQQQQQDRRSAGSSREISPSVYLTIPGQRPLLPRRRTQQETSSDSRRSQPSSQPSQAYFAPNSILSSQRDSSSPRGRGQESTQAFPLSSHPRTTSEARGPASGSDRSATSDLEYYDSPGPQAYELLSSLAAMDSPRPLSEVSDSRCMHIVPLSQILLFPRRNQLS